MPLSGSNSFLGLRKDSGKLRMIISVKEAWGKEGHDGLAGPLLSVEEDMINSSECSMS